MKKLLGLDCEFGGLGNCSLLTTALIVTDLNFQHIGSMHLALKPADGRYIVTAQGLKINKINLIAHDAIAIPYEEGGIRIREFLRRYADDGRLTVVGKNVTGDLSQLWNTCISQEIWYKYVHHAVIDINSVCQFLRICNDEPLSTSVALKNLIKSFGLKPTLPLHNALGDADMTLKVCQEMKEKVKK